MVGVRSGVVWRSLLAVAALAAMAVALWQLFGAERGVLRETVRVGETPVTVYRAAETESAPAVLIAHGFAGSRQMMASFALTLARNGYVAVTYDFKGHGRHPQPLTGALDAQSGAAQVLVEQTAEVADYVRARPETDGRLAVLGHSMAGNILVRYVQQHDAVRAMVGVSMYAPTVDAQSPPNLQYIVGQFEGSLRERGREVVAQVAKTEPAEIRPMTTYRNGEAGGARQLVVAPWVEHVGVLYSQTSVDAARGWLDAVFGRDGSGWAAARGPWIALLLAAIVALARPLADTLPRAHARPPLGRGAGWRELALVSGIPAVATPLILAPLPTAFLPVLVADYVALHFGVYGALSAALLWWRAGRPGLRAIAAGAGLDRPRVVGRVLLGTGLMTAFILLVLGGSLDRFVTSFYPVGQRWPVIAAIMAGTLVFTLADEWLTRGPNAVRGAYPATKVLFLLSLGLAVALDLESLFFLIIVFPVMIGSFILYGLFSRWVYRRTGHPAIAGIANGVAFAWALGVTFPIFAGGGM
jgi:esterase/lipase